MIDYPAHDRLLAGKTHLVPDNLKAIIALFAGGAAWNTGVTYLTIILVSILFLCITLRSGVEVQLSLNRYRDFVDVLFIRLGKWKVLAPPEAILISRKPDRSWAVIIAMNVNVKSKSVNYMVDLITTGDRDVLLFNTRNQEAAYNFARSIATQLGVKTYERETRGQPTEISEE